MYAQQLPAGVSSFQVHLESIDFTAHYLVCGDIQDTDEAIVCVHGWPTSAYLYRKMMPSLAKDLPVIALDLPGFGQSDKKPQDSYSFPYHAKFITALLDKLGIKKVHLVVHDLGGPIGVWWASENEARLASLVLLDTLIYPEFSWAVKLFVGMSLMPGVKQWLSGPKGIRFSMRLGLTNKSVLTPEVLAAYQAPFASKGARIALLKAASRLHMDGFKKLSKWIENTELPLCMIYAANDAILPDVGDSFERLGAKQPRASIKRIPDCGHFYQEEKPDEIAAHMQEFYGQHFG